MGVGVAVIAEYESDGSCEEGDDVIEEFDDEDYDDGPDDIGGTDYARVPRYADGVGTGNKGRIKDGGQ